MNNKILSIFCGAILLCASISNAGTITFSWTGEEAEHFNLYLDGQIVETIPGDSQGTAPLTLTNLEPGLREFQLSAVVDGNESELSDVYEYVFVAKRPVIILIQ